MGLDLSGLRRKAASAAARGAELAEQRQAEAEARAAAERTEKAQKEIERIEGLVERNRQRLPRLCEEAASSGWREFTVFRLDNSSAWGCGKQPTSSLFSHSHSLGCLRPDYAAVVEMIRAEGMSVRLEFNYRALPGPSIVAGF